MYVTFLRKDNVLLVGRMIVYLQSTGNTSIFPLVEYLQDEVFGMVFDVFIVGS